MNSKTENKQEITATVDTTTTNLLDNIPETPVQEEVQETQEEPAQTSTVAGKQRRGRKTKNPGDFPAPESFHVATMDDSNPKAPLYNCLISEMEKRNVRFVYTNSKGEKISTIGTLRTSEVPTTRKVNGRLTPRKETNTVFYDVRHGIYRQFDIETVVEIIK